MDRRAKRKRARAQRNWMNKQLKLRAGKLAVLAEARSNPFKNADQFIRALEAKGFERLGSGFYSTVIGAPESDKVIKILQRPTTDGWLDYVHWGAKEGFAGTLTPKVFSYKLIKTPRTVEPFGIAVMERLDKTMQSLDRKDSKSILSMLFSYSVTYQNEYAKKWIEELAPGANKFVEKFTAQFDSGYDLHGGNYMFRKDGSFVISDPLSGIPENKRGNFTRLKVTDFTPVASVAIH